MAFRTRRKHRRGVRAFYYRPPFAPPPYSLVITKTMTVHSDARQDESAHSCWPIQCQKQQPDPSVVTRAISRVNLQPTSSSWWRLSVCYCRPVFGQYLCICIGYFLLQCCPSAQAGLGGWSLKVISDAVSMSHAEQPNGQPNTAITFLEPVVKSKSESITLHRSRWLYQISPAVVLAPLRQARGPQLHFPHLLVYT